MGESIVGLPSTHDSDYIPDAENSEVPIDNGKLPDINIEMVTEELPFHIEEYDNTVTSNDLAGQVSITDDSQEYDIADKIDTSVPKPIDLKPDSIPIEQKTIKFDTSTPKSMLKKPVSKPLEPSNRKRKLIYTPAETRKQIVTMINEKEYYIKHKRTRELQLSQFAEEEHQKNMQHKEELHRLEVEFKEKHYKLMLKKLLKK